MEQFNKHSAYALMNALKYIRKYVNKYPYFLVLFLLQEKWLLRVYTMAQLNVQCCVVLLNFI